MCDASNVTLPYMSDGIIHGAPAEGAFYFKNILLHQYFDSKSYS